MRAGTLHRRLLRVATTAATLSLVSVGGCALPGPADPETAEYRRMDARLRAADEYETLKRACRARGGVVFVNGSATRLRARLPDLSTARCGAAVSGLSF